MRDYFKNIPNSEKWTEIKPIAKGWSLEKKYYIKNDAGEAYLIRILPRDKYEQKKKEFEVMQGIKDMALNISKPLSLGILNEEELYMVFTWVEGEDLEETIKSLSKAQQYALGLEAGRILNKLHSLKAPRDTAPWADRMGRKIDRKIKGCTECEIRLPGDEKIINFINENKYLLKDRPQCFHHGDYHIGNMVLSKESGLGIIDLNRLDYGDPWEEFNRIPWCAAQSPYFASGRINGYFDGKPTEVFFRLMALYIGSNQLSSVYWAIPFGEGEVKTMLRQGENILRDYNDFNSYVPAWYIDESKMDF